MGIVAAWVPPLVLALVFAQTLIPRFQHRLVLTSAMVSGLVIPAELMPIVGPRILARTRYVTGGILIGAVCTNILLVVLPSWNTIPPGGAFLPIFVSAAVAAIPLLFPPSLKATATATATDGARPRRLTTFDYLAPQVMIIVVAAAVWVVATLIKYAIILLHAASSQLDYGSVVLTAIAPVGALVWLAALIARTPHAIRRVAQSLDNQELAWNDAFLGQALFVNYVAVDVVLLVSLEPLFNALADTLRHMEPVRSELFTFNGGDLLALLLLPIGTLAAFLLRNPYRHYLRRIWPNARKYGDGMIADGNVPQPVWPTAHVVAPPAASASPHS